MKAIALISGGLDSVLAAKVVSSLGIEVVPLNFKIPFCKKEAVLPQGCLGKDLERRDIGSEFLKLLDKPKHGFGSNMNPCIDCKILMLSVSRGLMEEFGASFVVTGEVLGQRPMSQNRQALQLIEKSAGLEDLVLRPLSARLLPETIPEKEGWIRREALLDFGGRTRKPQMALARQLDIDKYAQPAGGCLLTDPSYARRLKDLLAHKELNLDNLQLSKLGRHFRISAGVKLVVGRNESENRLILKSAKEGDHVFFPGRDIAGPVALARGRLEAGLRELCCAITCRYCDMDGRARVRVNYFIKQKNAAEQKLSSSNVFPAAEKVLSCLRV